MIDSLDQAIVRKLQEDLPVVNEPYKQIAEELGISEELLLDKIKRLKEKRILRRMGGILYHRRAGFKANALVVWEVSEDRIQQCAEMMAAFPEVSHCYEREKSKEWPYNIYTMVHSQDFETCEKIILEMAQKTTLKNYEVLYSTKELKKSSMKYFADGAAAK